jgi:glyoxylase I family protein
MKLEHIGLNVSDPAAMAQWYEDNLGMRVVKKGTSGARAHFLADSAGQCILEVYNNPKALVPDYASMDPLVLHLAFSSNDVPGDFHRLIAAGALGHSEPAATSSGDELAMLRDPWGLAVQLAHRAKPMT